VVSETQEFDRALLVGERGLPFTVLPCSTFEFDFFSILLGLMSTGIGEVGLRVGPTPIPPATAVSMLCRLQNRLSLRWLRMVLGDLSLLL
jgi:hypothetical protein